MRLPLPMSDVSNGEWCPRPPTAKQRLAARLLGEEAGRRARRLGLTRAEFLRSAAGTATAFMVLNQVHGLDQWGDAAVLPLKREHCDDPAAGRERLRQQYFIVDVQTHHVDLTAPLLALPAVRFGVSCLRFLPPKITCTADALPLLGQANYVKEMFVDSETAVGVISGVPQGTILPPETMAATRDLVNQLAGSERALSQAMIDPTAAPGGATATDSLAHQVEDLGARAIKCYTGNPGGSWWLDDERVSYPMLAAARKHRIGLVNVHKGLPGLFGPMAEPYVHTRDLPKVVRDWPDLNFAVYHSGYFIGSGITEFIQVAESIGKRKNLYAEIGSAFAIAFLQGPDQAAHLLGQLLKTFGSRHVLWGTDSIWWGSPQWQIDAFKALTIPPAMQEQFGYPPLTTRAKRRILGLNAARLYGIDPRARRCTVDGIDRMRAEQGGFRAGRSLRVYGPRTRREFLALLAHGARAGA